MTWLTQDERLHLLKQLNHKVDKLFKLLEHDPTIGKLASSSTLEDAIETHRRLRAITLSRRVYIL